MNTPAELQPILANWSTIVGEHPRISDPVQHRELWLIDASDGQRYYLKRLGPWRDYPLADEARVLRHLAQSGIPVAEFIPTDSSVLYAGAIEDCFVLIPHLPNAKLTPPEILASEHAIGSAMAAMHCALAAYPWPTNSHPEDLCGNLLGELLLPDAIAEAFAMRRDDMVARIALLPLQNVHGDMSPENILLAGPGMVSGFIDFDHLPLAPRVWDMGKYLSRRLRLRWRGDDLHANPLDHLTAFLRGYRDVSQLSDIERSALPSLIMAGNILEVSYQLEITTGVLMRRKLPDHDLVTEDAIAGAAWHLAHWDEANAAIYAATS